MILAINDPIEVWLSQRNMRVFCTVVHEDESTEQLGVDALSIRGGQREMTGYFIDRGYKPVGRWQTEQDDMSGPTEVFRRFVPAKSEQEPDPMPAARHPAGPFGV